MRVAFVTELYAPSVGGQETRFRSLAKALVGAGHHVEVFCIGHRSDLPADDVVDGVPVHRHPCVDGYHDSHYRRLQPLVRLATIRLPFAWWARRRLEGGSFDAVLYNQSPMVHIALASRRTRHRAVIDWCEVRPGPVHHFFRQTLPRMVAANLSITAEGAATLEAVSGRPILYLPSGVWTDGFFSLPRPQRRGVLFLGRLFDNKDVPLLVAGWQRYRQAGGTEPLIVAGDGPARSQVDAAVAALPASLRAEASVLGGVDDRRKVELLASSVLLAITSNREGFPNVVAEAAASALPVATVDAPYNGTAAVVRRYEMGVVGTPDPDGVAGAIQGVVTRWDGYSAAARRTSEELEWNRLGNRLAAVLASVSVDAHRASDR